MILQNPPKEVKSELQTKLESEGWVLMTNTSTPLAFDPKSLFLPNFREMYREVKITQAFDIHGNPIPEEFAIAVYTRGRR